MIEKVYKTNDTRKGLVSYGKKIEADLQSRVFDKMLLFYALCKMSKHTLRLIDSLLTICRPTKDRKFSIPKLYICRFSSQSEERRQSYIYICLFNYFFSINYHIKIAN